MEIITLFNHKGGVAKTTNAFCLGWKLAQRGNKVILVDADSQCNLTGMTMGLMPAAPPDDISSEANEQEVASVEEYVLAQQRSEQFWDEVSDRNIHSALRPAFLSEPLSAVRC